MRSRTAELLITSMALSNGRSVRRWPLHQIIMSPAFKPAALAGPSSLVP